MISLSSLSRSSTKPPRVLIHGMPGIGKTTFACSAPAPVVIQTEDGLGTLDVPAFPLAKSYDDVMQAIGALYEEPHEYQTVVLDSLDWLEPLVWAKTCATLGVDSIEEPGYGKGYVESERWWRALFTGFTALRDHRNLVVVMTAHSQVQRIEDPLHPAYDRYCLKLHKRAAALADEYSDVILFATTEVRMVGEAQKFSKDKRLRAVSDGDRIVHASPAPAFLAKNRYSLPATMPLSWDAFIEAMGAARGEPNPIQSAA
jgi:hypothetical protein